MLHVIWFLIFCLQQNYEKILWIYQILDNSNKFWWLVAMWLWVYKTAGIESIHDIATTKILLFLFVQTRVLLVFIYTNKDGMDTESFIILKISNSHPWSYELIDKKINSLNHLFKNCIPIKSYSICDTSYMILLKCVIHLYYFDQLETNNLMTAQTRKKFV